MPEGGPRGASSSTAQPAAQRARSPYLMRRMFLDLMVGQLSSTDQEKDCAGESLGRGLDDAIECRCVWVAGYTRTLLWSVGLQAEALGRKRQTVALSSYTGCSPISGNWMMSSGCGHRERQYWSSAAAQAGCLRQCVTQASRSRRSTSRRRCWPMSLLECARSGHRSKN